MTPDLLASLIIRPVLEHLDWPQPRERAVLLVAIAIQESKLKYRKQMPTGPARSFWQIEHPAALDCIRRCRPVEEFWMDKLGFSPADFASSRSSGAVAMQYSDLGACAVAAGILQLQPGRLPRVSNMHVDVAWFYYLKSWRPGKPRPDSWAKAYSEAMRVIA